MINKKINIMFADDGGGSGGSGGAVKFNYGEIDSALGDLEGNINAISAELDKPITVTSYQGNAQAEVESYMNSIRTALQSMKPYLTEFKGKIKEVRDAYETTEANMRSAFTGSQHGTGSGTGSGNNGSGGHSNRAHTTV